MSLSLSSQCHIYLRWSCWHHWATLWMYGGVEWKFDWGIFRYCWTFIPLGLKHPSFRFLNSMREIARWKNGAQSMFNQPQASGSPIRTHVVEHLIYTPVLVLIIVHCTVYHSVLQCSWIKLTNVFQLGMAMCQNLPTCISAYIRA